MANSTQDTSSLDCIPEIYLERRSAQSTHHSHLGRVQPRGEGVDEKGKQPTAGESNDDLIKEGFIPYNELKLHHLPEAIRTQENLDRILSIGERVVCVNNNQLSEERNLEKEMKMPGVVLKGTGYVHLGSFVGEKTVSVFTNRHVLYNREEVLKSTIDLFFDSYRGSNQVREMERTQRGSGQSITRQNSKTDFCIVQYELPPNSKTVFSHEKFRNETLLYMPSPTWATIHSEKSLGKGIVCVISHPLGRWKHVSFGEIVTCRPHNNTFLYNAPTKPGSSGAPIIIFAGPTIVVPPESFVYHEGVDHKTNMKIGHIEKTFHGLTLPTPTAFGDVTMSKQKKHSPLKLSLDEIRQKAQVDIRSMRIGAFLPIFAAFVLHPEKYCSRVLTLPSAPPCQSLSKRDVELSAVDKKYMSLNLFYWSNFWSSLFPPSTSESAEPGANLAPFLATEAPCWCQAIVEAVVHTSRSDKDTGLFLRPDAVCGDFRQNPRWPWSLDRCGGSSGPGREPMLKHCLLKECLDVFRGSTLERNVTLHLLVLIRKANEIVKQTSCQTSQAQHGSPGFTGTIELSSAHEESNVQPSEVSNREKVSSSNCKQLKVVCDVYGCLQLMAPNMTCLCMWILGNLLDVCTVVFQPLRPQDDCVKNFHKALELISHLQRHYIYDHPDSPTSQGVPSPLPKCECGRPSWADTMRASSTIHLVSEIVLERNVGKADEKKINHRVDRAFQEVSHLNQKATEKVSFFTLMEKSVSECISIHGLPCPLERFLGGIDSLDNFRNSCDLISVGLTSAEVFLFNSRNLLRQYRHHLCPVYMSTPVSMFGRPGLWAGGHTPDEVKITAWKLIRGACTESHFGRECLEVLERDTARREKLIDLYVDMKQLKFSGDIEEEKMTPECMQYVMQVEKAKEERLSVLESMDDNPTYFVMRTFLKLVPWPSWDRTR